MTLMEVPRCDQCRFWLEQRVIGSGLCGNIGTVREAGLSFGPMTVVTTSHLITAASFGCVAFERKP